MHNMPIAQPKYESILQKWVLGHLMSQ